MSDKRFIKPGFDQAVYRAMEEAGEFIAACGKLLRHGPLSVNPLLAPEAQETNIAWVWREMADYEDAVVALAAEIRADPAFGFLSFNPGPRAPNTPTIEDMKDRP